MASLAQLTEADLANWIEQARAQTNSGPALGPALGKVLDRIAPLAAADPDWLGVWVQTPILSLGSGEICSGNARPVALMSVVKPFLLLAALHHHGDVAQWIDAQPSQLPFNSLAQLQADGGRPRNAMINSGAITLADKLSGDTATERCQKFCDWLNQQAGCALALDLELLAAVRQSDRTANLALLAELERCGFVERPELALDTYEQLCCLAGSLEDLARLGLLLAVEASGVAVRHRQAVNAQMLTCGLYEASADYAAQIGLPIKSGVSGAVLALVPRQGAIACYGPALDAVGNSVLGLKLVELLAEGLGLNLFG